MEALPVGASEWLRAPASASAAELGLHASAEHPLEHPELSEPTPATLQLPPGRAFTD
jgi:hypothetical protein